MIDLKDGLISSQWPSPTSDVEAFAYALQQAISRLLQYSEKTMCISGIDKLDGPILDQLAVELRAVNYSQDYDIEKKRNIIKNVLTTYASAGTAGSIKQFIRDVYNDSDIEEWYQYEGDPGHFRINIYDVYSEEKVAQINEILAALGKCSTAVDAISFNGGESEAELNAFAGVIDYTVTYTSKIY